MPKVNELTSEQIDSIRSRALAAKTTAEYAAILAEIEDDDPLDEDPTPFQDAPETLAAPAPHPLRTKRASLAGLLRRGHS